MGGERGVPLLRGARPLRLARTAEAGDGSAPPRRPLRGVASRLASLLPGLDIALLLWVFVICDSIPA